MRLRDQTDVCVTFVRSAAVNSDGRYRSDVLQVIFLSAGGDVGHNLCGEEGNGNEKWMMRSRSHHPARSSAAQHVIDH